MGTVPFRIGPRVCRYRFDRATSEADVENDGRPYEVRRVFCWRRAAIIDLHNVAIDNPTVVQRRSDVFAQPVLAFQSGASCQGQGAAPHSPRTKHLGAAATVAQREDDIDHAEQLADGFSLGSESWCRATDEMLVLCGRRCRRGRARCLASSARTRPSRSVHIGYTGRSVLVTAHAVSHGQEARGSGPSTVAPGSHRLDGRSAPTCDRSRAATGYRCHGTVRRMTQLAPPLLRTNAKPACSNRVRVPS